MNAIELTNVFKRYGTTQALNGLSLEIARGEMFGLIGPDGAGKTTAIRLICGLLHPDKGSLRVMGLDPVKDHKAITHKVGYLSQRFSLYGDLTIDENIAFFAEIHGVRGWRPRRDELLDLLRMTPFRARLAERLSGGMKQKLALACTLIHTPELLILDEPTTGVDPVSRRDFWRILARLQREGLTILVTTPYLDEAERCQRVALIDQGHLLMLDTPDALRTRATGELIELIARPKRQALEWLQKRPEVGDVQVFGERLHATLPDVTPADASAVRERLGRDLVAAGMELVAARSVTPSLEDVFIASIRAREAAAAGPQVRP